MVVSDYEIGYEDGYYGREPDPFLYWSRDYWDGYEDGDLDYEEDYGGF